MEIAHDLRDGPLDAEELVGEEVVNLDRLVLVQPLGARIVRIMDIVRAARDDQVVNPGVRELGHQGIGLHDLEVLEQRSTPLLGFARGTVPLDYLLKVVSCGHQLTPC